jgi:hypothetical protein
VCEGSEVRPVRAAGHDTTAHIVQDWDKGSDNFAKDRPSLGLCVFLSNKRRTTQITHRTRNASLHQKHGHVSRMACITPICALALHFSMCSFAHWRKASTIASFDTIVSGHAEGIDVVIR